MQVLVATEMSELSMGALARDRGFFLAFFFFESLVDVY